MICSYATKSHALMPNRAGLEVFSKRLARSQVYVPETGACIRRDKYWGRALSEAGLRDALRDFFAAGAGLRARVVRRVLRDLDALRRAIAKQTNYRFYSW